VAGPGGAAGGRGDGMSVGAGGKAGGGSDSGSGSGGSGGGYEWKGGWVGVKERGCLDQRRERAQQREVVVDCTV
jgi:hypothetical protein